MLISIYFTVFARDINYSDGSDNMVYSCSTDECPNLIWSHVCKQMPVHFKICNSLEAFFFSSSDVFLRVMDVQKNLFHNCDGHELLKCTEIVLVDFPIEDMVKVRPRMYHMGSCVTLTCPVPLWWPM